MVGLKFLSMIIIISMSALFSQGYPIPNQSMYAGANLNSLISTGAGARSPVADVRGLPIFGGRGLSMSYNPVPMMPVPRTMPMIPMMPAQRTHMSMMVPSVMFMIPGMGAGRGMSMGEVKIEDGRRMPSGITIDDGIVGGMSGETEQGGTPRTSGMVMGGRNNGMSMPRGMPAETEQGGTPWTGSMVTGPGGMPMGAGGMPMGAGGMPMGAGGMPMGPGGMPMGPGGMLYGNMAMMNALSVQRGNGGMPMGQPTNVSAEPGEEVTASTTRPPEEPAVTPSQSTGGGESGDAATAGKDV